MKPLGKRRPSRQCVWLLPRIFDTTFGFANAATGVYASYVQNQRIEEGVFRAFNREAFVQDNWKVKSNLTLDSTWPKQSV